MDNKIITAGRLEFGTDRNYEQVVKLFEHRRENYYRNEVYLNAEEIFDEAERVMDIPRHIVRCSDRQYRNTTNLLKQIAQFAIAGDLNVWRIRFDKPTEHLLIEPRGDKTATQAYLQGRELLNEEGRENEAREALDVAIKKFARHALAYERRGYVNFRLGNLKDALYDYNKSIDIYPTNPDALYGRALVKMDNEDWEGAIADFEEAIKHAIPHQPVYWRSRALKGDLLVRLGKPGDALTEYKFFYNRRRTDDDELAGWDRRISFAYGKLLAAEGMHKEAKEAFDRALQAPHDKRAADDAEILVHRGLATQQLGKKNYVEDWRKAATQGSEKAAELLESMA